VKCWYEEAQRRGYKRAAFLIHRNAGAEAVLRTLETQKGVFSLEWTSVERFNQGERDFRLALAKIRETRPDLLFLYGFDPELPIILRQLHEIGWSVPITTITVFDMIEPTPLLEGAWYVGIDSPTSAYRAWFEKTFGRTGLPYGAGVYEDYLEMVREACERFEKKPTSAQIAEAFRARKDFDGACGPIHLDARGVWQTKPCVLEVRKGRVAAQKNGG